MTRRNWARPKFRLAGRSTESVHGDDLRSLLGQRTPRRAAKTKAELRAEAERAFKQFKQQSARKSAGNGR
jgi:hypothetical protein